MRFVRGLLALLALSVAALALAENGEIGSSWSVRVRQIEDGLPSNQVTGVVQTPDGYLWVATRNGLARFNGDRFETFSIDPQPGVFGNSVREMFLDATGHLWLGANRSLVLRVGPASVEIFPRGGKRPPGELSSVAEDAQGRVWLAFGPNFAELANKEVVGLETPDLSATASASLARDSKGQVWGALGGKVGRLHDGQFEVMYTFPNLPGFLTPASSGGLWLLNGSQLFRLRENQEPELSYTLPPRVNPVCLLEDHRGAVWIGTLADGLLRVESGSSEAVQTSHQHVTSLSEDREGNLWAGTFGGGLNLIRPKVVEMKGPRIGQLNEAITSVCQDSTGSIWVATASGQLLRNKNQKWESLPASQYPLPNGITCVTADRKDTVFIGTLNHGIYALDIKTGQTRHWTQRDGLPGNVIRGVFVAKDGTLWFAAGRPDQLCHLVDGRVQVLNQPSGPGTIRSVVEDAQGVIWVGHSRGQLFKVQGHDLVAEASVQAKNAISIRNLNATPDGTLWIGYANEGLGILKDGRFSLLTSPQGLSDAPYSKIMEDPKGFLWLAGNSELTRLSMADALAVWAGKQAQLSVTQYGRSNHLMNLQVAFDAFPTGWQTSNHQILIATGTGLLEINPDKLQANSLKPPVIIEQVSLDEQVIAREDSHFPLNPPNSPEQPGLQSTQSVLQLPPDHRRLEIEFSALSFSAPENVVYRYRLEGFDSQWTETHRNHTATYPRLAAGDYTFRVLASNNSGLWNYQGQSLAIHVAPFVTQTWWFRLAMIGLFTGILSPIIRFISHRKLRRKIRKLEAQAELDRDRARISRDLHDDLGGSVTQIKLLGEMALQEKDLPPQTGESLQQITSTTSQMLKALNEIVWAVNPRNDTLPNLINYLAQYSLEYMRLAGLPCTLELPDNPPDMMVSSKVRHQLLLATKEALTNVVRHAQASTVRLSISLQNQGIQIEVQDDGRGLPPDRKDAAGNGLRNMQQRLASVQGTCNMVSNPGTGTTVRFHLPLPDLR